MESAKHGVRARFRLSLMVAAMASGSLAMWTALPLAWMLLGSNLIQSNLFSYLFALVACPVSMVLLAGRLSRLSDAYRQASGRAAQLPGPRGWLRSVSDESGSPGGITLLEALLIASALVALVAWVAYLFLFSDPTVVTGPTAPGDEHGS